MTYDDAVREVYFWQYSNTGCFNQKLLDLFGKADCENRRKLFAAYPTLMQAYEDWQVSGSCGNALFQEHGLMGE